MSKRLDRLTRMRGEMRNAIDVMRHLGDGCRQLEDKDIWTGQVFDMYAQACNGLETAFGRMYVEIVASIISGSQDEQDVMDALDMAIEREQVRSANDLLAAFEDMAQDGDDDGDDDHE